MGGDSAHGRGDQRSAGRMKQGRTRAAGGQTLAERDREKARTGRGTERQTRRAALTAPDSMRQ